VDTAKSINPSQAPDLPADNKHPHPNEMNRSPTIESETARRPARSSGDVASIADHADDDTTLIIGTLTYTGTGWTTSGDALLANTAADQARKRREAGHDELADEYNRSATSRQAA
jgi:hypothetical protein